MKHAMKDADDLDVFSEDQVELTRHFEINEPSRKKLVLHSFTKQSANDIRLMLGGLTVPHWQRAAYEARQLAKANPEDKSMELMAQCLWSMVRYIQEAVQIALDTANDPEAVKFFEEQGMSLPRMEEL